MFSKGDARGNYKGGLGMEEEDHFSLLYSQLIFIALAAAAMAARLLPLQLSFSPHSCTHSRFSLYLALKYKPPL